jgi:HK97 family phage portal protein
MWIKDFLEKLFPTKGKYGGDRSAIVIDIPAELYYKELAIYTASSLIGNAISRSEIKCFVGGVPQKNADYFLLNVSPNKNETSSIFWHKVINKVIRTGEALVIEATGKLYCADSYVVQNERPILGDIYSGVTVGNFSFNKTFTQDDSYRFRLDDVNVKMLVDGMYEEYGKIMSAAAKSFKSTNGQKYKIHIEGVKSGDAEFEKEFEEQISEQLKSYIQSENAVYPEFDGYTLEPDKNTAKSADDFLKLKSDLMSTVAAAFHIPESMMTGNITNMADIVGSFLSFGVDPYADMISEALNKRGGIENYIKGNTYMVDTGRIHHRDIFNIASGVSNLISSGTFCIDEAREELGRAPLNTAWSRKHFITKNFEEIEKFLKTPEGGE